MQLRVEQFQRPVLAVEQPAVEFPVVESTVQQSTTVEQSAVKRFERFQRIEPAAVVRQSLVQQPRLQRSMHVGGRGRQFQQPVVGQ